MLKKKEELLTIVTEHNISPSWFPVTEKDNYFKLTLRDTNLAFEIENTKSNFDDFRYKIISLPTRITPGVMEKSCFTIELTVVFR